MAGHVLLRSDGLGNQIRVGYLAGRGAEGVREITLPNGERTLIMESGDEIIKIDLDAASQEVTGLAS